MFSYTKLMQAMVAAGVVTPTDPYFNLVTLLLPGNGTNGAQNNTFLDSSTNNFTITRNGNTTQGTFSPFSQTGWSNYFDGTANSYLTAPDNTAYDVGSGDFVLEGWVYLTASTDYGVIAGQWGIPRGYALRQRLGKFQFTFVTSAAPNTEVLVDGTTSYSLNTWYHVAVIRTGSTIGLFVNGTREATNTSSPTINNSTDVFSVGRAGNAADYTTGYISNVRLVKGSNPSGYSATSSTLTVPTAALTAVTGTSILTCQSNRFVDNSTTAATITSASGVSVQAFSPFAPTAAYSATDVGGSGYFDGTGDYLTNNSNSLQIASNTNFTVECWIYRTVSSTVDQGLCFFAIGSEAADRIQFTLYGAAVRVEVYAGALDFNGGNVPLNAWTHIAIVRSGSTMSIYVNGTSVASATWTNVVGNTGGFIVGANRSVSNYITGCISGLRVLNGTAQYTTTFTPPTAPPTAITNTSLLLNFTNAGITDATAKNIFETVGNASISTAQSKFGGGSMFFDGTGDYLTLGNTTARSSSIQVNSIGTANATIEMWVYSSNSSSSLKCLIDTRSGQGTDTGYGIYQIANNVVIYGNGVKGNAAGQLAGNTWTHLAVTRANTTNYVFIGGTLYNTFTYGNTLSSNVTIASDVAGSNAFTGYIDDLRITNGYARYTANFTPTTVTFPLQ